MKPGFLPVVLALIGNKPTVPLRFKPERATATLLKILEAARLS